MTDLQRKGESLGVPGMRCDGMDVLDTHAVLAQAVEQVRTERRPVLVEAITYRFRGHSMADPEQYRSKEEVAHWRERDPIPSFAELLIAEGVIEQGERERIDAEAIARVDRAVSSPRAPPSRRRSRSMTTCTCSTGRCAGATRCRAPRRTGAPREALAESGTAEAANDGSPSS